MTTYAEIYRIHAQLSNLNSGQIGIESSVDADLGFKMWGGKNYEGTVSRWLAKDQNARVAKLWLNDASTMGASGYLMHDLNGLVSGLHTPIISITADDTVTGDVIFEGDGVSQSGNTFTFSGGGLEYTEGVGIDITSQVVSLDHLGIEDLTNPGADRILFWDDSEMAAKWLSLGSNLSISGTTINSTDTNTTYSAGTGLNLSSTTFSLSHLGLQSLTAPAADRIYFYDYSSGASAWLTLGTNLAISGTTLNATDTNTTYTAGAGLSLSGTEFSNTGVLSITADTAVTEAIVFDGDGVSQSGNTFSFEGPPILAEFAIGFGDSSNKVYGNTGRLTFAEVGGVDTLTMQLLSLDAVGTIRSAMGLTFSDGYRAASTWGTPGIMLSAGASEWSAIEALIGSEGSVFAAILAAGGTLDDAYDFGGPGLGCEIEVDAGAVYLNSPVSGTAGCLLMHGHNTATSTPIVRIQNDSQLDDSSSISPYAIYLSGDAGMGDLGNREKYAFGHRIWSGTGYVSIGRTDSDSGFQAWYSATEGSLSNPDGRRCVSHLAAYAYDTVSGTRERNAYIDVYGEGVSGGLSYAKINVSADDFIDITSNDSGIGLTAGTSIVLDATTYVSLADSLLKNVQNASFGADCDTVTPASGVATFSWAAGSPDRYTSTSSDIASAVVTRPIGHGAGLTWTIHASSEIDVGSASGWMTDATTTATFVSWIGGDGNPDVETITVPSGSFLVVSIRYIQTDSALVCIGSCNLENTGA